VKSVLSEEQTDFPKAEGSLTQSRRTRKEGKKGRGGKSSPEGAGDRRKITAYRRGMKESRERKKEREKKSGKIKTLDAGGEVPGQPSHLKKITLKKIIIGKPPLSLKKGVGEDKKGHIGARKGEGKSVEEDD